MLPVCLRRHVDHGQSLRSRIGGIRLRLPGLRVAWEEEELNPISRPQLYLVMWETPLPGGMGLTCHMMHREDVWDAELAGQMMQHFEAALAGLVP